MLETFNLLLISLLLLSSIASANEDFRFTKDSPNIYFNKNTIPSLSEFVNAKNQDRSATIEYSSKGETKSLSGISISIDTRDEDRCIEQLNSLHSSLAKPLDPNLCKFNEDKPILSIFILQNPASSISVKFPATATYTKFDQSQGSTALMKDTKAFLGLGVMSMAFLASLPSSITKWDEETFNESPLKKWRHNTSRSPVYDEDEWAINYIGHPLSGAAYYLVARHAGFNRMQSFGYSVFMSTFFWEYGFEAVAERPSRQDLWITPIIGSMIGEYIHFLNERIDRYGKLYGSEFFADTARFLSNPARPALDLANRIFDNNFFIHSETELVINERHIEEMGVSQKELGINLIFQF
jgi:hypothetical protein